MSSESTVARAPEEVEVSHFPEVIFPAGNSDFRAVRNRCAQACRVFNSTPDDADPEERSQKWLDIVRPDRDRAEDGILAVTHDQTFADPTLKAKTPFVKPPVFIDYGIRLHVGGSTFINRNCMIMDTPVADVVIGEGCNIGPNCCIVGVTHPVRLDERLQKYSIGQPVTIGDNVWIGANVTILGGVTIGSGAVIGACSLVKHDIPPLSVAFGVPARVVGSVHDIPPTPPDAAVFTHTLAEAKALSNRLPLPLPLAEDEQEEGDGEEEAEEEEGLLDFDLLELLGMESGDEPDDDDEDADERGLLFRRAATPPRRRFSVVSGSTAHNSRLLRAGPRERLNIDQDMDRMVRALLLRRQRQQCRRLKKAWATKAIAAMAVVTVSMVLCFLLGLYLGASKISQRATGLG
ncbi:hypothetical protein MYCTH_116629 [Thermothelomyces thermophilus ATCC 42464]|uniref:Uncharacterized protein n=1 Tax=Thermothelomyces thermophilus (strain ATCC 42464 / BCRC 31852 / DSM 1799) TaxID=573729 RepID=G2QJ96_THET4|nr:uncharacterized protein MYCTH_116629 [Thermothelomyces thermophilus ATCC 42464]AEO60463.1 hypothetical protein MYCTH_116629 [Thermothelomyces thermophilus ATCC 42464]